MPTTITARPDGYPDGAGGWVAQPSGALHTNVDDEPADDATWAAAPSRGQTLNYDLTNFAPLIPAYAQVRTVTPRLRVAGDGAAILSVHFKYAVYDVGVAINTKPSNTITTVTYPPVTAAPGGGSWTPYVLDRLKLSLWGYSPVKVYEAYVDAVYYEAPTVAVTAPTGATTGSQQPKVTWTYDSPENAAQERFDMKVFTDAQVNAAGFDPSKTAAFWSTSQFSPAQVWTIEANLPAGGWYVYVRASDKGSYGRYGPWASSQFFITGSPPAMPTMTVANDDANRRNTLTVTENDNLLGFNQAGFEVTNDGTGWYVDTGCTMTTGTTAGSGIEGGYVLKATSTGAAIAKLRCGGQWGTLIGGAGKVGLHSSTPARVSVSTGNCTTASFTAPSGAMLIAMGSLDYYGGANNVGSRISDSGGLTWTLVDKVSNPGTGGTASPYGDEAVVWRAVTSSAVARTVTLDATIDNLREKSLQVLVMTGQHATPASSIGAHGTGWSVFGMGTGGQNIVATAANSYMWACWTEDQKIQPPVAYSGTQVYSSKTMRHISAAALRRPWGIPAAGQTANLRLASPTTGTHATWCYFEVVPNPTPPPGTPLSAIAGIPVAGGATYRVVASAWQEGNAARNVRTDVEWYDDTGTLLSTNTGSNVATSTASLFTDLGRDVTAPASAVCAVILLVFVNPSGASEVMNWDRVGLMPAGRENWSRGGVTVDNMFSVNAGSQQTGLGGWALETATSGASVAATGDATVLSGQSVKVTMASGELSNGMTVTGSPATPGLYYTLFGHVKKGSSATYQHTAQLQFLDGAGMVLGQAVSDPIEGATGTWSEPIWVSALAPAGAVRVEPHMLTVTDVTGAGRFSSWTRLGLWVSDTQLTGVPTVWQPGPLTWTFPYAEFSDDAGATWAAVRNNSSYRFDPTTNTATVYDYEAPPGTARLYRASVAAVDYIVSTDGYGVMSPATDPASATLAASGWWLHRPLVPGTRLSILHTDSTVEHTSAERQAVVWPIGASLPLVIGDAVGGEEFTLRLYLSSVDFATFEVLRKTMEPLLLQTDYDQWYVRLTGDRKATVYPDGSGTGVAYLVEVNALEVGRP